MKILNSVLVIALMSLIAFSGIVSASPVYFSTGDKLSDDSTTAAFSGTIELIGHSLEVILSNDSAIANGGYISAIALNRPGSGTPLFLSSTGGMNTLLGEPIFTNDVDANPSAPFDFGASTGHSWLGGGDPTGGIGVGGRELMSFSFNDVSGLDTMSFINALNADGEFMAIRFQGFEDGGSSKYGVHVPSAVPLPAAVWLFGSGLIGLIGFQRKPKTNSSSMLSV